MGRHESHDATASGPLLLAPRHAAVAPPAAGPVRPVHPASFVPAPMPVQRVRPLPTPPVPTPALPAWVPPPGYDAPPAGLDGPLDGPPLRGFARSCAPGAIVTRPVQRTTATAVVGAVVAGVAVLATGGTALGALARTATPAADAPARAASASAEQCSDVVADHLDDTASALAAGPRATWSGTVASRSGTVAERYGTDSAEYAAYTTGAAEILDWLRDPSDTASYESVVGRIVPGVLATCDRAYG